MTNVTMLAHSRPALTEQALYSLGKIDNVTVLLDRASHELTDIVNTFSKNGVNRAVTYNHEPAGTGKLRNDVIWTSENVFGRGDYLYLSDNDVFFHPGWLPRLIDCYEAAWNSGCRVVGGVGHPYHQLGDLIGTYRMHAVYEVMAQPLQSMLMRWSVWDKYGPFCETPVGKVCQGEDVDFTNKLRADGYKLGVVDPALIVNTGITNSFGEKIPGWELVKAQCPEGVICE